MTAGTRHHWRQYNIALVRREGGADANALFLPLREAFASAGSQLTRWFFMRKAPDVRLRVKASAAAHAELLSLLQRLTQQRAIRSVHGCVYEPQRHLFGGTAGMALAHRQFHADSRAWLELTSGGPNHQALNWDVLSLHLLNDLFLAAVESVDEAWEVWQLLAAMRPRVPTSELVLEPTSRFLAAQSDRAHAVLAELCTANRALAESLSELHLSGRLALGQRTVLAYLGQFHFNRWGARGASAVIAAALAAQHPEALLMSADRRARAEEIAL